MTDEKEIEKIVEEVLKGCEHDGSYIAVSEVKRIITNIIHMVFGVKDAEFEVLSKFNENLNKDAVKITRFAEAEKFKRMIEDFPLCDEAWIDCRVDPNRHYYPIDKKAVLEALKQFIGNLTEPYEEWEIIAVKNNPNQTIASKGEK